MEPCAVGARCAEMQHGCEPLQHGAEASAVCAVVGASGRPAMRPARAHRVVASSEIAKSVSIMRAGAAAAAACARESPALGL